MIIKERPESKGLWGARTALPQELLAPKIWHPATAQNPTLERLDGTNEPVAKGRVRGNISHLATGYFPVAPGFRIGGPR